MSVLPLFSDNTLQIVFLVSLILFHAVIKCFTLKRRLNLWIVYPFVESICIVGVRASVPYRSQRISVASGCFSDSGHRFAAAFQRVLSSLSHSPF